MIWFIVWLAAVVALIVYPFWPSKKVSRKLDEIEAQQPPSTSVIYKKVTDIQKRSDIWGRVGK